MALFALGSPINFHNSIIRPNAPNPTESFPYNSDATYLGTIERSFRVLKIEWSIYDIDHPEVKGTIRVVGIPSKIYEVPRKDLPTGTLGPVLTLVIQGRVGFVNHGTKGASDPRPITPDEYTKLPKEDITNYVQARDEPTNQFLVDGSPQLLVRTKTVMTKAELVKDRYDAFGDPHVLVTHNTSHRVSEYKPGRNGAPSRF
jgi:hypothetical protein